MKVLVADDIAEAGMEALTRLPNVTMEVKTGLSEAALAEALQDVDALLVRSQTKVTEAVLTGAKRLKVIGRAGVGVDNIDVSAATKKGIVVVNALDGNTISAAEHTFAMILAAARTIPQAHVSMINGRWDRKSFVGVELHGKTLGVIGMGRIGTKVARRAQAFHMHVVAYDPVLTDAKAKSLGVTKAPLHDVAAAADFITIHTPLVKETRNLVNRDLIACMKSGVRLVNCARGGIVDEIALAEALAEGRVAGAAFDVYEQEPLASDHPFRQLNNVILTPHIAASTEEAQFNVAVTVAEEVANILAGRTARNAVNLPSLPDEQMVFLKPYLSLGEQLGSFAAQLLLAELGDVDVLYTGDLAGQDVSLITRAVLKGLLTQQYGDEANYVNAPLLADTAGLTVTERKQAKHQQANLIQVTVRLPSGQTRQVSGTIFEGVGPRLIGIDHYHIDAQPAGTMIYTEHADMPGMIGQFGSILGRHEVNIGSMQVGRHSSGGQAIMLMSVDRTVTETITKEIQAIKGVNAVRLVEL